MELQEGHGYHNYVLYVLDIPGYSRAYLCGILCHRMAMTLMALKQTRSAEIFSQAILKVDPYNLCVFPVV